MTTGRSSWRFGRQGAIFLVSLSIWLIVTIFFIGFRPEHILMALVLAGMFFAVKSSRRLMVALLPFVIFGISYDWMNLLPNYEVNPVDVAPLYEAEKSAFGISSADGTVLTPNEYFARHTHPVIDFLAGLFYLCWVPLPIIFGLWLYAKGERRVYLHFAIAFLLVNLMGFAVYYIHPAAPPWYIADYGTEAIPGTPGSTAGLQAFDDMTGLGIFNALYGRNANVFAAMPSLHSAYTFVAFIYSLRSNVSALWKWGLAIVTIGIWFTAVYTSHHYLYDVIGGIVCSILAISLFEIAVGLVPSLRKGLNRYVEYITPQKI